MRKTTILGCLLCCACTFVMAQDAKKYSTYYYQRATLFEQLPITSKDIVFVGNSITDGGEWCELFDSKHVKNRGISGDVAMGVYDRLDPIVKGKPKKVFLLIGINDVSAGRSPEEIMKGIEMIASKIKKESPKTKLYIQSILPVNKDLNMFHGHTSKGDVVIATNELIRTFCQKNGLTFVDLYAQMKNDGDEKMNPLYTNDGLHLLGPGYIKWKEIIMPYVKE